MESENISRPKSVELPEVDVIVKGAGVAPTITPLPIQVPTPSSKGSSDPIVKTKLSNSERFDSKTYARTNLLIAVISLFIIPYMAMASFTAACFGLFYSFKNNSGWGRRSIYLITMVVSISSLLLKAMMSKQ